MKANRQVCITTWYGTENYGSNLQAIGLSKTFQKLGCDVFFLGRFDVKLFFFRHPRLAWTKVINKMNQNKSIRFFSSEDYFISDERNKRLKKFSSRFFDVIQFLSSKEWNEAIQNHMIFVSGSDIIWNPARGYPDFRFLDFAYYAGLNRFSYASSVGAKTLPRKYYKAYRRYLGSMKAVSVREQSVADTLQPIIGRQVTQVVDPTLLLTRQDWYSFSDNASISVSIDKAGFVLCYFVMGDLRYWEYVEKIKDTTKLQIVVLPMHYLDEKQPYDIVLDGTPFEFAWLIRNAEIICTDSFHACVLSMVFEKEFYLLRRKRKAEDAKYDDFLCRYHLRDRLVNDESVFVRNKDIDYRFANEQLEIDKARSLKFLVDVLEECNG